MLAVHLVSMPRGPNAEKELKTVGQIIAVITL
jgi:hypothetical protein